MKRAFIRATLHNKVPVVSAVFPDDAERKAIRYPLTPSGCRQMGRKLTELGIEFYQYSSSADFPKELKPSFRGDVRAYIEEGVKAEFYRLDAPRKTLCVKLKKWCRKKEFQDSLTDEERMLFKSLFDEAKK